MERIKSFLNLTYLRYRLQSKQKLKQQIDDDLAHQIRQLTYQRDITSEQIESLENKILRLQT